MKLSKTTTQSWNEKLSKSAIALLKKHQEASLFLLNTLKEHGVQKTDSAFSGDFQCLVCDDKVVGVFLLNGMGRLLLQTDKEADYSNLIIDSILPKISRFTGLIGDWELTKQFLNALKLRFPTIQQKVCKKEILYRHDLGESPKASNNENESVRFLTAADYHSWDKLISGFREELNSVLFHNDPQKQQRYIGEVENRYWWGLFRGQKLITICAYTAKFEDCAQIGGVYTLPEERGKGSAKQIIKQVMLDSKNIHNVKKLVLFTHENNHSAQKVYEGLGFKAIGYIGLITC